MYLLLYIPYTGLPLYLETWKNLKLDNIGNEHLEKPGILENLKKETWKNRKFLTILTNSVVKFDLTQKKFFYVNKIFL